MITITEAKRLVTKGAAALDKLAMMDIINKGWAYDVSVEYLDMMEVKTCILGQVFDDSHFDREHELSKVDAYSSFYNDGFTVGATLLRAYFPNENVISLGFCPNTVGEGEIMRTEWIQEVMRRTVPLQ